MQTQCANHHAGPARGFPFNITLTVNMAPTVSNQQPPRFFPVHSQCFAVGQVEKVSQTSCKVATSTRSGGSATLITLASHASQTDNDR
jgi:hypothetical protein